MHSTTLHGRLPSIDPRLSYWLPSPTNNSCQSLTGSTIQAHLRIRFSKTRPGKKFSKLAAANLALCRNVASFSTVPGPASLFALVYDDVIRLEGKHQIGRISRKLQVRLFRGIKRFNRKNFGLDLNGVNYLKFVWKNGDRGLR